MKIFGFLGIAGLASMMANVAVAAAPASAALSALAPSAPQIVTVGEVGPIFNGRTDVQVALNGLSTPYQNIRNIGYLASITWKKDGQFVLTPGTVTDGVTVDYKALQLPDGRVKVHISFADNRVLPFSKFSVDGHTIQLPRMDLTKYNGVVFPSYGNPASLKIPLPDHGTATLRFTVNKT